MLKSTDNSISQRNQRNYTPNLPFQNLSLWLLPILRQPNGKNREKSRYNDGMAFAESHSHQSNPNSTAKRRTHARKVLIYLMFFSFSCVCVWTVDGVEARNCAMADGSGRAVLIFRVQHATHRRRCEFSFVFLSFSRLFTRWLNMFAIHSIVVVPRCLATIRTVKKKKIWFSLRSTNLGVRQKRGKKKNIKKGN